MPRKLFSMYCSAFAIEGYHDERERALALLDKHLKGKAGIVVLGVGDPQWLYGQASFALEDGQPLKFLDRFTTVASNGVFDALLAKGSPAAILFTNEELKKRFEDHPAFRRFRGLVRLVPEFRAEPQAPRRGLLDTVKGWFGGSSDSPKDERSAVAADLAKTLAKRLSEEAEVVEATHLLLGLFQSGAVDKAIATLEERVAKDATDAVGLTLLAVAYSELRDHAKAFKFAKLAIALPTPPAEAWLWFAKEAWSEGSSQEGLDAISRLEGRVPERWPRSVRCGVLRVRSSLLTQRGSHTEAADLLQQAADLDGSDLPSQVLLADCYLRSNRVEAARTALDSAHVLEPNNVLVLAELCSFHARRFEDEKLSRLVSKLRRIPQGAFEVKRFPNGSGAASGELDLTSIDADRKKMWARRSFPSLFDLCDNTLLQTIGNLGVFIPSTSSVNFYERLSIGFVRLVDEPLNSQILAAIGACLSLAGHKSAAAEWVAEAVSISPENREYHNLLVQTYREAGDDEKAYVACDRATALDMSDKRMLEQWVQLIWAGPRLKALASLAKVDALRSSFQDRAREMSKDDLRKADGLMALSVFLLAEDPESAIKAQREAIRLKPDSSDFHSFHCETLESLGRFDEALVALRHHARTLIPTFKEDLATIESLCEAVLEDGARFDTARLFALVGMKLSKDAPSMRVLYARALIGLNRLDAAEAVLRSVADGDSESAANACGELGEAFNTSGRHEEALSLFSRLQVLRPKDAWGFLGAGISLWFLDREAEAATLLEEALKLNEGRAYAWGFYGRVLKFLQRTEEAEAALRRAASFPAPPRLAVSSLARLLIDAGRPSDALTLCTNILSSEPSHGEAMAGKLEAEVLVGDRLTAERCALAWVRDFGHDVDDVIRICDAVCTGDRRGRALSITSLAVRRFPHDAKVLTEHAWQLTGAGKFVDASAVTRRSLDLTPEDPATLLVHAYVHAHLRSIAADEAKLVADRLLKDKCTPDRLRIGADLLRAAGVDSAPHYGEALKAALEEDTPQHHVAAWSLFHLRRFDEALAHIDRHLAENPDNYAAKLDGAVFRFVSLGSDEARTELSAMIRQATGDETRIESLCEIKYLVPQWESLALGRTSELRDLGHLVDSALGRR